MKETPFAKETLLANLEQEMRKSYLDYAMSVIIGRALPDVRDGLKPVHRRILYAMHELSNTADKPYKKSARVVGDVIGKYHPHGESAVYDAIVRMAQHFSMRYPLVDGQGNFGSVDGDAPAAMRYTEIRLAKVSHELLSDLEAETVDFVPNYDETERQPAVLPARLPNLLVNGSSGIAVGMATNIPPHNLGEVISGCLALLDNPDLTLPELMEHIPGPDFPTAGLIINAGGPLAEAYASGRGQVVQRARTNVETADNGRETIIVEELPYQVNKARLIEKIAEMVKAKQIEGIAALRDESDKSGMRIVIEVKRNEQADVLLNRLFKHTQLQNSFGINLMALDDNQPRLFGLKDMLEAFLRHRREVVTRRSLYQLGQARTRAHVLEGLSVALGNIDEVVAMIKAAKSPQDAREALLAARWPLGAVSELLKLASEDTRPADLEADYGRDKKDNYRLSPAQVQAILDLRLHRLTGLEQDKIRDEYRALIERIEKLLGILQDPDQLLAVLREELTALNDTYAEPRRSELLSDMGNLDDESLVKPEMRVVTMSNAGYVKSQAEADYTAQHRGGRGSRAARTREEDFISDLFVAHSLDTLLCFSSAGRVYWLRVFQLPQASQQARGKPLINLLQLQPDERITTILPLKDYQAAQHVVLATANGTIKKCNLEQFSRARKNGIAAIKLKPGDHLIGAALADDSDQVMLFSSTGRAVRYPAGQLRAMGRTAAGVRSMKLTAKGATVITMLVVPGDAAAMEPLTILVATRNGYGKRTPVSEYRQTNRATQGVLAIKDSERNGPLISAHCVEEADEVMLIDNTGILIRSPVAEIRSIGRNTQGVRLINLTEGSELSGVSIIREGTAQMRVEEEGEAGAEPQAGVESLSDTGSQSITDSQADSEPQSATDSQLDSEPQSNAESPSDSATEPQPAIDSQPDSEPQSDSASQSDTKPKAASKPKAKTQPKLKDKPKAKAKPKAASKPKAAAKPKSQAKPKAASKPKAKAKPKSASKPKAASKPKSQAKPKSKAKRRA